MLLATMLWDPEFTGSERAALVAMHLALGLTLILGFGRTAVGRAAAEG